MSKSAPSINPSPMKDEHKFRRDILFKLAGLGTVKGTDLKAALEADYGIEISHGRLYPNLDRLADGGLLEKHENVPDNRTNSYELTPRGRREVLAHHEWEAEQLEGLE